MKYLLSILAALALTASCSNPDEAGAKAEKPLCTAEAAGAVTAQRSAELLNALRQSDRVSRGAACERFKEVLENGSNAKIADSPSCRWDNRNSNGNPHFLISLHLTQLKGQAEQICGNLK
jgi:hypothetical protein